MIKTVHIASLALVVTVGCAKEPAPVAEPGSLAAARTGFQTRLVPRRGQQQPVTDPPRDVFQKVYYQSPIGKLPAYLSRVPSSGAKRPAIVWVTGGDCNTIDEVWIAAPAQNDQTAAAYRQAGIIMMFPSLRGGNDNPGQKEGFLGEVDDVIGAAKYLAQADGVDRDRIYLGGHSTGGTLALLVAECTDRFRAVFAFGPKSDVADYESRYLPFDTSNPRELELRSPGRWLAWIRCPTFVLEGTVQPGNIDALRAMARASTNPLVQFLPVEGADHFSVLAPTNELIARKIVSDKGPTTTISLTEGELSSSFAPSEFE